MGISHADAPSLCDSLESDSFPKAKAVSVESVDEHQFIIDNVPAPPGIKHDTNIICR